jgi:hypothetical protein
MKIVLLVGVFGLGFGSCRILDRTMISAVRAENDALIAKSEKLFDADRKLEAADEELKRNDAKLEVAIDQLEVGCFGRAK